MSNIKSPRQIAVEGLIKVTKSGGYSNLVLNSLLEENNLTSEDKSLSTAIFYGTLDRMVTVDYYLKKLIKTPLKKIKPFTLAVLRIAVYQIKYMEKIPVSAAVNEAVKLIKKSNESYNASFVNAVLRNLLRTEIPLPNDNSIYDISVCYSCPEWIVSVLVEDHGVEFTKNFLENALKPPPLFARVNTLKITAEELCEVLKEENISAKVLSETALLLNTSSPQKANAYKNGLFFIQDLSCQKAIEMLDINENSLVLDLCAAPGGKSFGAALLAPKGKVVSCDLYEQRASLIKKGAQRLGAENIEVYTADATEFTEQLGLFDRIICDVPCSGLGVIRRKPDIKYKQENSFEELAKLQQKILENACRYLKKDGKLLYSTCTLSKNENGKNVELFLQEHPEFSLVSEKTFSPQTENSDGFYAAVIKKN